MEKTNETAAKNDAFIKELAQKAKAGMSEQELAEFAKANMPVKEDPNDRACKIYMQTVDLRENQDSIWAEAGKRALLTAAEIGAATLTAGAICLLLIWAARKIAAATPVPNEA